MSRLLLWTLWVIYRERRRVIRAREAGDNDVQPNIEALIKVLVAFRKTAVQLGVLMIKLGQFLSSRADLLPERALAVLSSLQDDVPAAPYVHVVGVIESELGRPVGEIFSSFDEQATAAASLGQVHRAVLAATGEVVAVKVQRPHIEQLVNMDLSTIRFVIWVISRFVKTNEFIDLMGFFREFKRTILEEIDYNTEAANAQRFREMFDAKPEVFIPRVHLDYVSRRVLVLEWVDGIKVNDYAALEAAGISRLEVAKRTVEAYLYQFFEVGFFHADPHPGNIFVQPGAESAGPVIAFVDFGMVGSLTKSMKQGMKSLFLGFLMNNAHGITEALQQLGFIGRGANIASIERGIALMMEQYYGITMGQARDLDFSQVAQEIEALLYRQPFQIPAQFAFTGRAIGTLSGLATGLAPEFNLLDVAVPYARNFLGMGTDEGGGTQQLLNQLLSAGRTLVALPAALERVVAKLETGQVEIRVADGPVNGRGRRRGRSAAEIGGGRLSVTMMFAVSVAGGVALTTAHEMAAAWFCFGLAGAMALRTLLRR